ALIDDARDIAHDNVLALHAEVDGVLGTCYRGCASAIADHLYVFDFFVHKNQSIQQCRAHDDRGSMLVVMKNRDLHSATQLLFHDEAVGRFDVFKVDSAERGLEHLAGANDILGVRGVQLEVEDIDVGESFEQDTLAFHDWLGGERSDISQAQN